MTHCPYLQDLEHRAEPSLRPAYGRYCLAQRPPAPLSLAAQARLCLHGVYADCPHYHQSTVPVMHQPARNWLNRTGVLIASFMLALLIIYAAWQGKIYGRLWASQPVHQPTMTASFTPTATATPTPTATTTPTPTVAPTPTATPRPRAYSPPTRIRIPKIGVDADVVEVGYEIKVENGARVMVWKVADWAAGFHRGSAYPGQPSNIVIAAHNNIRGRIFRHLVDLLPGDDIYLYVGEQEFHYVATQRLLILERGMPEEIRQENAQWIQPTDEERLTLVSCWPFIKPDHRVVVIALPKYE